jgi:hypothetical protein
MTVTYLHPLCIKMIIQTPLSLIRVGSPMIGLKDEQRMDVTMMKSYKADSLTLALWAMPCCGAPERLDWQDLTLRSGIGRQ